MWYWIRKKSFISNGERNLTKQYLNLTRKEWLSATVCDTYKIEDCEKFRAKIKYFKKDLMIDLSSFVSQIILFRPFYMVLLNDPFNMVHMILVPGKWIVFFAKIVNWLYILRIHWANSSNRTLIFYKINSIWIKKVIWAWWNTI